MGDDIDDLSAPIDVYVDTVPGPGQRGRGQRREPRPAPAGPLEHGYRKPDLEFPVLARPTSWPATAASRDAVVVRFESDVLDRGWTTRLKDRHQHVAGVELLVGWLDGHAGETWQQRWLSSGLNDHGRDWTDHVEVPGFTGRGSAKRNRLLDGAAALIVLDVIRPSYRWLYGFTSKRVLQWFRDGRDPDGVDRLIEVRESMPRFTPHDCKPAFLQLTRILIHNGGTLADISVED